MGNALCNIDCQSSFSPENDEIEELGHLNGNC